MPSDNSIATQLVDLSHKYGGGQYNLQSAAEVRWARIQDSLARNPTFDLTVPRYQTAYAETVFPYQFMVDGRSSNRSLDLGVARGFFQRGQFPHDFWRRNGSFGVEELAADINTIITSHPIAPGSSTGVGNYTVNQDDVADKVRFGSL